MRCSPYFSYKLLSLARSTLSKSKMYELLTFSSIREDSTLLGITAFPGYKKLEFMNVISILESGRRKFSHMLTGC